MFCLGFVALFCFLLLCFVLDLMYLTYSRVFVAEAGLVKRHQELPHCWTQTIPTMSKGLTLVHVKPSVMLLPPHC